MSKRRRILNKSQLPDIEEVIGDKNYLHIQAVPSSLWIINHGLNKFPSPVVFDSANNRVHGEITYIDENNIEIRFVGAFSGKATFN